MNKKTATIQNGVSIRLVRGVTQGLILMASQIAAYLLIDGSKLSCRGSIVFTHWGSFEKYHGAVTVK